METDEMTRLRGTLSRKGSKQPGLTRSVLTPRHLLTLRSEKLFQPGTVFKIEQSLFSDEIMVVSSIGKPYLASDTNGVFQSLETHTLRHFVALLPQGRT